MDWFNIEWLDGRPHQFIDGELLPLDKVKLALKRRAAKHGKTLQITVIDGDVYMKASGNIPIEKVVPTNAYFTDNLAIVQR